MNNFYKEFMDELKKDNEKDILQSKRYSELMIALSERISNRSIILNKLEELNNA